MQAWGLLQFMFSLALAACGFALIIGKMHMIERLEEQELWKRIKEKIESL